ncbi:trypsin-like peptidase domain-containing protein [Nonomuraea sp. CA-141351]|uniref:nSTAND1 domain-containing NTPase n=1 Tax=Nonomuraea sp. CA-141351 TaxID=3239996 RepID=UPI003D8CECCC
MSGNVRGSLARIWEPSGSVIGAGFLVGRHHVLTCAHVVAAALGIPDTDPEPPTGTIELDFPLAASGSARITASIVLWTPVGPDGGGDIAGLLLAEDPPAGTEPALLISVAEPYGLPFRTFGFPGGRSGGDWAEGLLADVQATSWLQIEHERQTGRRVQPGYSGAPVWVEEHQGVVGMVVAADRQGTDRVAYAVPTDTLVAAWPDVLTERTIAPSPYQGLAAFREADAELFFGRDDVVARLAEAVAARPLTAVVGPSGGGKSSVVQAGLIPALRASGSWTVAVFRPRKNPYEELAAVLMRLLQPDMSELDLLLETPRMAELLQGGRVDAAVRQIVANGRRLLLVGDQFEELYTHHQGTSVPQRFVADLLKAAAESDVRVLLTMRADFLNQALDDRVFSEALTGAIEPIGPLSEDGLRAAIVEPAALRRARFEPGLVGRILADVGDQPGRLPLLEFTLSLLWDRQHRQTITHSAYDGIGGVEGALTHHAERVLAGYDEQERVRVRQVLLQLVAPGDGTADVRRLAVRSELRPGDWEIARRLADDRLVVTGAGPTGAQTIEIVHEALIAGWTRLREWVSLDRTFRIWQERVREQIRIWRAFGEDQGVLLRGPLLAEAETWMVEREAEITDEERAFVRLSRERQEQEDARYRLLYEEALSRQLVAQAELVRGERANALPLSVLLAAESLRRASSFEADLALRRGLALLPEHSVRLPHDSDVQVAAFSPDGRILVTAGDDASARVWDVRTGERLLCLRHRDGGWIRAVAFSPDSRRLVTGCENGEARMWSLDDGAMLVEMMHGGWVGALAFTPDGSLLASGCDDGMVRVWDGGVRPRLTVPHEGWVRSVAFDRAGSLLLTGGADRSARVWNVTDWSERARHGHDAPVRDAVFSPLGASVASASDEGTVAVWPVAAGAAPVLVLPHEGAVTAVAFSPDGRLLGTACDDGHARIWDASTGSELVRMRHGAAVRDVVFEPSGRGLLTGSDDGTARIWSAVGAELLRVSHRRAVRAVAVSPDGAWGASASQDDEGALWSTTAHAERYRFQAAGPVVSLAVDASGSRIAVLAVEGAVQVWRLDDLALETSFGAGNASVLALSPDGGTLAATGEGGDVGRWSLPGGDRLPGLATGAEELRSLAFSPDGRSLAATGDLESVLILTDGGGRVEADIGDIAGVTGFSPDGTKVAVVDDAGNATVVSAADGTVLSRRAFGGEWWGGAAFDGRLELLATIGRGGAVAVHDLKSEDRRCEVDHEAWVTRVVLSADGLLLATVGEDAVVRVWDTESGAERCRLPHPATVADAVFTPDGHLLVTGAADGFVRGWPLRPEDLLAQAATQVHRSLTREEWGRYLGAEPYPESL